MERGKNTRLGPKLPWGEQSISLWTKLRPSPGQDRCYSLITTETLLPNAAVTTVLLVGGVLLPPRCTGLFSRTLNMVAGPAKIRESLKLEPLEYLFL